MNGTNESRQSTDEFQCDIPEKITKGSFLKLFEKENKRCFKKKVRIQSVPATLCFDGCFISKV